MGAGKNEYQHSDKGILAINGKSGDLLWQHEADDQVFGSPTFIDINKDGTDDVIISGRSVCLKALDGKTGKSIWEYKFEYEEDPILKYAHFNFYNSVAVPDQNNDGIEDFLIQNGGNSKAKPYVEEGRYAGVLMLFDSSTGQVLAADTMPDGRESYMSPICFNQPDNPEPFIVFGTGGETLSGHLYVAKLSDLKNRKLSEAKIIATEHGHGFIAPPSLADINGDGYYDIVSISHGSTVFAIDGKTNNILWKRHFEGTECSNSLAVGYFTSDKVPDFFTFINKGIWPNNTGSIEVMLAGKNWDISYQDSIGCSGYSSPVVYDLDQDGIDEAIISVNDYDCNLGYNLNVENLNIINKLIYINFKDHSIHLIDELSGFKNIFSTPWIGDLDKDGYLDIVHCQYYSPSSNLLTYLGMKVKRIATPVKIMKLPIWGAYMGSNGDGIFRSNMN